MHRAEGEDSQLVKSYVLLPLILSALERDAKLISVHLRTPDPYLDVLSSASALATKDLAEVRKSMRRRGVKVYEQQRLPNGIEARFLCRGYHEQMLLLNDLIVAQGLILMRKYLGLDISAYSSYPDQFRIPAGQDG